MYIKTFESFSESIDEICNKYNISNYIINEDGSIDVDGDVNLSEKNLTKLPLKFGKVSGNFDCSYNELISLEGSPDRVSGSFYCENNQLTNLEGSPKDVSGNFLCFNNKLISLEGSPNRIVGVFNCRNNKLTSLEGSPDRIGGDFYCGNNLIHNIYRLFNDPSNIELFNDYDIIRDNGESIVLDRLNAFLDEIGKPTLDNVKGYKNI